jgi:prepilin-type N-terminal cleavage/methylation domain-containing protein
MGKKTVNISSQKGFTLIELIIVAGLIGLIVSSILTSIMLFIRTLQFTNEQLYLNTELDKIVNTMEVDAKRVKINDPFNYPFTNDIVFLNGNYYAIQPDGSGYRLMRGRILSNLSPFVNLRFSELRFEYRYYVGNSEIVSGTRPSSAQPGSLRIIELVGKVILPASKKEMEFYKSFFVEYTSTF